MKNALAIAPSDVPLPKAPKGKQQPDDDNRGELDRLVIEKMGDGYTVRCSFEPKTINPKLDRYAQQPEDEEKVFEGANVDACLEYVKGIMTGQKAEACKK